MEDDKPLPFIKSSSLNAAFLLEMDKSDAQVKTAQRSESSLLKQPSQGGLFDETGSGVNAGELKIILPLPSVIDRLIWLPNYDNIPSNSAGEKEQLQVALLEDVIVTWALIFFQVTVLRKACYFKLTVTRIFLSMNSVMRILSMQWLKFWKAGEDLM